MKKIPGFLSLDRSSFYRKIRAWKDESTCDRRLSSQATKKGHIHRIGTGKVRRLKMKIRPRPTVLGRNMKSR